MDLVRIQSHRSEIYIRGVRGQLIFQARPERSIFGHAIDCFERYFGAFQRKPHVARWWLEIENYNYARDYDSQTGRYIEPDPLGLDGGPDLYRYVADNPLSFSDRVGLVDPYKYLQRPVMPPWNGSLGAPQPQDNVCSSIAAPLNYSICNIKCCKAHDDCYAKNGCTAWSWLFSYIGAVAWPFAQRQCQTCNANVVDCIKANVTKAGYFSCSSCVPSK